MGTKPPGTAVLHCNIPQELRDWLDHRRDTLGIQVTFAVVHALYEEKRRVEAADQTVLGVVSPRD